MNGIPTSGGLINPSGTLSTLSRLQQNRTGSIAANKPEKPTATSTPEERSTSTRSNPDASLREIFSQLPIADIQHVAKKAGFVGVSERDIQQAYLHGESLLADYRI